MNLIPNRSIVRLDGIISRDQVTRGQYQDDFAAQQLTFVSQNP